MGETSAVRASPPPLAAAGRFSRRSGVSGGARRGPSRRVLSRGCCRVCVFRTEMWTAGLLQWLALVSAVTALVQPAARGELQVD